MDSKPEGDALNRKVDQQAQRVPTDPQTDGTPKRRTWEGYADDYRVLSEDLVEMTRQQQEATAQIRALEAEVGSRDSDLKRLKARRQKDLERLAAVSRTRDLLEKRAAAQMAKLAAAMARPVAPAPQPAPEPEPEPEPASSVAEGEDPSAPVAEGEKPTSPVPAAGDHDDTGKYGASTEPRAEPEVPREAQGFVALYRERDDRPALGWADKRWWLRTVKTAQSAHKQGRLGDAQLYFEVALLTHPTASLWDQLGHVLRESGQFLEGELAYRRSLEIRPGRGEVLFLSGYCMEMAGRPEDAVRLYDEALRADPSLVNQYQHLQDFRGRLAPRSDRDSHGDGHY